MRDTITNLNIGTGVHPHFVSFGMNDGNGTSTVGKGNFRVPCDFSVGDKSTLFHIDFEDLSSFDANQRVNLDRDITLHSPIQSMDIRSFGKPIGMGPGRIKRCFKT